MSELQLSIEKILKEAQIEYKFISLPANLPMDVESHMNFHGKPLKFAMPNTVFKTEKGLAVVHRRGDMAIDNKKLKKALGVERLSLASTEDLKHLGLEPGLVPPLGYDLPFYMDKKVLENEEIYTGSGDVLFALKINPKDLIKLNKAIVGEFSTIIDKEGRGSRVYSGIRATGRLHLGNYLGAVKGMLALQDEYDCVFSVVDLHTITVPYEVKTLQESVRNIILDYLAAGLEPSTGSGQGQKCKLEVQSKVPQHTELAYLLSTIYPVSRLEDLPTYKDKKAQYPKYANMGLLYYPVLMAADVLLYKGELVPVGIDQEPHLEVMREIARKFNSMFGDTFPEPVRFKTEGEYVPSLLGAGKMSKSVEGSYINLIDDLKSIREKVAKIPTDSGTLGGEIPKEGGVANLFALLKLFINAETYTKYVEDYKEGKIRYSEVKDVLSSAIFKELEPFQKRRQEFEANPKLVDEIIQSSNQSCRELAEETMIEVREKMGF